MEKERKNIRISLKKTPIYRRGRRFLRLLRKKRKTVMAVSACAFAACCMLLIVWALVSALSGSKARTQMETVENVEGEPLTWSTRFRKMRIRRSTT